MASLSNLQQRTITGIIGAALMISLILINEYTFVFLIAGLALSSLNEFNNLIVSKADSKPNKFMGIFIAFFAIQIFFMVEKRMLSTHAYYLLAPLISVVFINELYRKPILPFQNIAYTLLGLAYTVLPFLFLIKIAFIHDMEYSFQITLGIFLILWISDVGAYFTGKSIGRTKLFPRISPGKTWEGAIGGGIFALGFAYLLSTLWTDLSLIQWLGVSIIIILFGMFGDLVESSMKRSMQIKDSGSMLPGHGGVLDRFDGLYLSLPVIYSFLQFFY